MIDADGEDQEIDLPIGGGSLGLEVNDFGPIIKAKVDLRPLTVFVGPSNTGKSYLAILIYALHQVFNGEKSFTDGYFRRFSPLSLRQVIRSLPAESISDLFDLLDQIHPPSNDSDLPDQHSVKLTSRVAETFRSLFNKSASTLSNEISRCFAVSEVSELIRRGQAKKSSIIMQRHPSSQLNKTKHTISLAQNPEFRTMIPANVPIPVNSEEVFWEAEARFIPKTRLEARRILLLLADRMILPWLVGPLDSPAFYLPADRTGIMHAHSVVVSALIANAPSAGLRPGGLTPTLSGVLADFLERLINIDLNKFSHHKTVQDLSKSIEDDILGGSIHIDRSPHVNYPRFAYQPHGWKNNLALGNTSSMVSELAPVVLYLRHVIKPGNVLILEMPESHLHPALQVEFTRELAALVKAGVRVLVTTHSEWLLEELANIVRRSQIPNAERIDNRNDKVALSSDQVGVWLFETKKRPKGSVVKEIHLDDSGLYPAGYDEVASALHNDWADTTSRIEARS